MLKYIIVAALLLGASAMPASAQTAPHPAPAPPPAQGSGGGTSSPIPTYGANAAAGEKIFSAQCKACHSVEAGANKVGPSLYHVVNQHSGIVAGYNYSAAMLKSGIVWGYTELNAYLNTAATYVQGTTMVFGGLKKQQDRADVIAYLDARR